MEVYVCIGWWGMVPRDGSRCVETVQQSSFVLDTNSKGVTTLY